MLDWTGTNSNIRYYGTNAHHDTVWTASSTGTVSATLRYDPFGTLTNSTGSLPDFRYQGSWFDATSSISWVVTRWYAPAFGRFLSEDSLLGDPGDPPSRHLYAYAAGEPIARWDPDGREISYPNPLLGTCGGFGCSASDNGRRREDQLIAFFRRFPGIYFSDLRREGEYGWHVYPGVGRGDGIIAFMDWIRRSGRIARSKWWSTVNREEVQGPLTAWYRLERRIHYVRVTSADSSYPYYKWITTKTFNPVGPLGNGNYGGFRDQLWVAHQRSLWNGIAKAAGYFKYETKPEQLFILKVVSNVETYARSGLPLDSLLDWAKGVGGYPDSYPATRKQACGVWWPNSYPILGPFVNYKSSLEDAVCG